MSSLRHVLFMHPLHRCGRGGGAEVGVGGSRVVGSRWGPVEVEASLLRRLPSGQHAEDSAPRADAPGNGRMQEAEILLVETIASADSCGNIGARARMRVCQVQPKALLETLWLCTF